ncbi:MAG: cryptochrome/photolyase family protein [Methylococcaceae bacterium]|nr:cryptochrome/photolyase family protein [Methylococcaceae bacterium]
MSAVCLILGDQLSKSISSLQGLDKANDVVLLCEVLEEATYVRHHQKKIAFIFSAMRHFSEELKSHGFLVRYVKLDDPGNTGSLEGEVRRALSKFKANRIIVTEPGEYRLLQTFKSWPNKFGITIDIGPDTRFICDIDEFKRWASGKKQLRMEYFYREMRNKYNFLMEPNGKPVGGKWNFDKENRKPPLRGMASPKRLSHKKSPITLEVLKLVRERFHDHFGALEPFHFAVTQSQALKELQHFIDEILPQFGEYQDAMVAGEPYLYHSLISSYLNAGLLLPLEVCSLAETAYRSGKAPLNAAEGFIRQILGWREYVRGIYWLHMPDYGQLNYLDAKRPLPEFYWSAQTRLFCVAEAVRHTRDHAYSHHIQRLMITGNFALLAGINPVEVCEWYLLVYSDAYEWVELPNTLGMALFADGGIMASKPYAASGKYINRMSNFCQQCHYDPLQTVGDNACPFNALYWDFLARHEDKLQVNQRLAYMYAYWHKQSTEQQLAIRKQADDTLQKMDTGNL